VRPFTLLALLSAVTCAGLCVCWLLSYSVLESPYGLIGGDSYRIGLYRGDLLAYHFYPDSATEQPRWSYHKQLNPLFAYNHNGGKGQEMADLYIAIWFLVALSALLPLAWFFLRFVRSRRRTGFEVVLSDATKRV